MKCVRSLLLLLVASLPASAETASPLPRGYSAVVCVPSHGGSATFIATFPPDAQHATGITYLLSCAHLLDDGGSSKPITLHAPTFDAPRPAIRCRPRFVAWDTQVDLSLICMEFGPVPHVAPVAPHGFRIPRTAISCGYDHLRWPGQRVPVSIFQITAAEIWTREKPIPGRSGGGLLDAETGCLLGVCLARVDVPGESNAGRGVFASLDAIHRFLDAKGYGWLASGTPPAVNRAAPAPT